MLKYSKDKEVYFEAEEHKYFNAKTGERYISVTTLLHEYVNPFDPDLSITHNYALKNNMTFDEVVELWREINETACIYGSNVHQELEDYVNTNKILDTPYNDIVRNFANIKFEGKLYSEALLYSHHFKLAGQVDLIELLPNRVVNIWDHKTNKELLKKTKYGQYMKSFLWKFDDVNFNHYQLQLSMYAYLCELKGMTIGKLTVLYINPETHEIEHHPCKYLRKEIIKILEIRKKELELAA